jgi:hypothetical protein
VIYNVFGPEATNMLFMRLQEYHEYLKPFVTYLNFMPQIVVYDNIIINKDSIITDKNIEEKLREI